ncbi:hypothetical protein SAMN05660766_2245 [Curtobacterium sp. 314Chir4.1]|nr:hypothetical protein SAMN05660766_2245 [Curtobacterium sp. 314Chir4.1]
MVRARESRLTGDSFCVALLGPCNSVSSKTSVEPAPSGQPTIAMMTAGIRCSMTSQTISFRALR